MLLHTLQRRGRDVHAGKARRLTNGLRNMIRSTSFWKVVQGVREIMIEAGGEYKKEKIGSKIVEGQVCQAHIFRTVMACARGGTGHGHAAYLGRM